MRDHEATAMTRSSSPIRGFGENARVGDSGSGIKDPLSPWRDAMERKIKKLNTCLGANAPTRATNRVSTYLYPLEKHTSTTRTSRVCASVSGLVVG